MQGRVSTIKVKMEDNIKLIQTTTVRKLHGDPGIATDAIVLVIGEGSAHFFPDDSRPHINAVHNEQECRKDNNVMLKMRSRHQTFRILK
jgi:hypothetical protein